MRTRRTLALVLLGLGTLLGFASGFRSLRHAGEHGLRAAPCYFGDRPWRFEF
ncbi:MAG TPA: hypothetical protein VNN80_13770 [Polyangiaceae bacterium]|jgi:hypothetical protein|nr:hypothetical protein [Polyangiaceae bacterium]